MGVFVTFLIIIIGLFYLIEKGSKNHSKYEEFQWRDFK